MKFLKSERAFRRWRNRVFWGQYPAEKPSPREYPCFAYLRTTSWGHLQEPVYLYSSDLKEMLEAIKNETIA